VITRKKTPIKWDEDEEESVCNCSNQVNEASSRPFQGANSNYNARGFLDYDDNDEEEEVVVKKKTPIRCNQEEPVCNRVKVSFL